MENNDKTLEVLKFAHEQEAVRQERTIKRLWILCILLVIMLVGTNIGWFIYESQFEDIEEYTQIEAEQDGDNNNIIGGDYYGTSECPYNQNYEKESEENR
jgi:hypothetical protein